MAKLSRHIPGLVVPKPSFATRLCLLSKSAAGGWVVTDTNNPIKARLSELRQEARISIQVKSGVLVVDTKGSLVDGNKAYVPLRYLNYLMASVRKNVLRASAAN